MLKVGARKSTHGRARRRSQPIFNHDDPILNPMGTRPDNADKMRALRQRKTRTAPQLR